MARIGSVEKEHNKLALGCWTFGGAQWGGQDDRDSMRAMARAFERGMNHFDTASGYGKGHSEQLVGRFIKDKRDQIFLASKQSAHADKAKYAEGIGKSLRRLATDYIDLYYIHWPRSGVDLRPTMEALLEAKEAGKIGAVGVSNFSVEQMEEARSVGPVDAHQRCYNLLWRWDESEIIPYCRTHDIAYVTYSSLAQGILTGKFPRNPEFAEGDDRPKTTLFDPDVWPHVYEAVEEMKKVASETGRPLTHPAVQWVAGRPGITSILVGVRNEKQVDQNADAMKGEIDQKFLDRLTEISDRAMKKIPNTGNIFGANP